MQYIEGVQKIERKKSKSRAGRKLEKIDKLSEGEQQPTIFLGKQLSYLWIIEDCNQEDCINLQFVICIIHQQVDEEYPKHVFQIPMLLPISQLPHKLMLQSKQEES